MYKKNKKSGYLSKLICTVICAVLFLNSFVPAEAAERDADSTIFTPYLELINTPAVNLPGDYTRQIMYSDDDVTLAAMTTREYISEDLYWEIQLNFYYTVSREIAAEGISIGTIQSVTARLCGDDVPDYEGVRDLTEEIYGPANTMMTPDDQISWSRAGGSNDAEVLLDLPVYIWHGIENDQFDAELYGNDLNFLIRTTSGDPLDTIRQINAASSIEDCLDCFTESGQKDFTAEFGSDAKISMQIIQVKVLSAVYRPLLWTDLLGLSLEDLPDNVYVYMVKARLTDSSGDQKDGYAVLGWYDGAWKIHCFIG